MPQRPIILFPDSILSRPCSTVSIFDQDLSNLIKNLWDTLKASPGVGLAAPQIGISKRVAVVDVSRKEKKHGPFVMVNPILLKTEGIQIPREGCLSVPDLLANVRRYQAITAQFHDESGHRKTLHTYGFEALAIQHELDHLDGKLFLDRVANLKTDIFRRKLHNSKI